jgi:C-terminal processing protease CtpA/Prc
MLPKNDALRFLALALFTVGLMPALGASVQAQPPGPLGPNPGRPLLDLFAQREAFGVLGLTLAPVDKTLRAQLELPEGEGWVVAYVEPDTPAAKAGLKVNDILLDMDGKPLKTANVRVQLLMGKPATLHIIRKGKRMSIEWNIREPAEARETNADGSEQREYYIGVPVAEVDETLRSHLDIPEGQGLVVLDVVPNSPAAKAGLKAHDILLSMAGKPLKDVETLIEQVQESKGKAVAVEILRQGGRKTIEITPEKRGPASRARDFVRGRLVSPRVLQVPRPGALFGPEDFRAWPQGFIDPVDKRLDELSDQIKELRKSVEELQKSLKKGDSGHHDDGR